MNFYSPLDEMVAAAKTLPENENIKLFLRHSIRYDNPPDGDYSKLLLTPEGIELAQKIGASIDKKIGLLGASAVERCQQTIREIYKGIQPQFKAEKMPEIIVKKGFYQLAGNPFGRANGGLDWFEYFHCLQTGDTKSTKGISLEMEAKPILDAIFDMKSDPDRLDIICSHDSHVIILASALFGLKTGLHGDKWCRYTEGFFFWGKRDDFYALWRGQKGHFKNFYC